MYNPSTLIKTVLIFSLLLPGTLYSQWHDTQDIFSGEEKTADIAWIPGSPLAEIADLEITINDPDFPLIPLQGNNCEESAHNSWDQDGDGWRSCAGDCEDNNPNVHPGMEDITNNKDDNCDGEIDEGNLASVDDDGDGLSEEQGDCNDTDASMHPDAEELVNAMDDNCDGIIDNLTELYDDDGDGLSELAGDCDDTDPNIHPALEELENNIDDNCDGNIDEGFASFDNDNDGFSADDGDCDDAYDDGGDIYDGNGNDDAYKLLWLSLYMACNNKDNIRNNRSDNNGHNMVNTRIAQREPPQQQ